jgi:ferritin-like metal-binding protein YciE
MKIDTLDDAFVHELSDMYNAEKQLTKALPKMAKAASSAKLIQAFKTHLRETEQQIQFLDKVVEICEVKLKRTKCDAMAGLIEEGSRVIKEVEEGPVRDAMLIAAAQKVEHYEIASYGTLVALADKLGLEEAADILEDILDQEKFTDEKLNDIAEREVNEMAMRRSESTGVGVYI